MCPVIRDLMRLAFGPSIASYMHSVNPDWTLMLASGRYVTNVRSMFLSKKHFRNFTTFSTLAQMC
jgi:hypothetical protein